MIPRPDTLLPSGTATLRRVVACFGRFCHGRHVFFKCVGMLSNVSVCFHMCRFASKCVGMLSNVSVCFQMCRYAFKCVGMLSNVSVCFQMCRYAFKCVGMLSYVSVCFQMCRFASKCVGIFLCASLHAFVCIDNTPNASRGQDTPDKLH